ncbi:hypothetical protein [Streptomyces sp. NPDC001678]
MQLPEVTHLTGASSLAHRATGLLVGFGDAATLMVGAQRFIALQPNVIS